MDTPADDEEETKRLLEQKERLLRELQKLEKIPKKKVNKKRPITCPFKQSAEDSADSQPDTKMAKLSQEQEKLVKNHETLSAENTIENFLSSALRPLDPVQEPSNAESDIVTSENLVCARKPEVVCFSVYACCSS